MAARSQAIGSISAKIGCAAKAFTEGVKRAEIDGGRRARVPAEAAAKMKVPERENRELRQREDDQAAVRRLRKRTRSRNASPFSRTICKKDRVGAGDIPIREAHGSLVARGVFAHAAATLPEKRNRLQTLVAPKMDGGFAAPTGAREWRTRQDSNL